MKNKILALVCASLFSSVAVAQIASGTTQQYGVGVAVGDSTALAGQTSTVSDVRPSISNTLDGTVLNGKINTMIDTKLNAATSTLNSRIDTINASLTTAISNSGAFCGSLKATLSTTNYVYHVGSIYFEPKYIVFVGSSMTWEFTGGFDSNVPCQGQQIGYLADAGSDFGGLYLQPNCPVGYSPYVLRGRVDQNFLSAITASVDQTSPIWITCVKN